MPRKVLVRHKKKSLIKRWEKVLIILLIVVAVGSGVKASERYIDGLFNKEKTDGCPEDMVFVGTSNGGICVDIYEESAGSKCGSKDPQSQLDTRTNIDNPDCKSVSVAGAIPWRFVSQNQAAVICSKSGKRLPTNKEWLAAAMGTPDKNSDWQSDDCQVAGNWSGQPGETGSGGKCKSPAGAYDMIGNVWEWVDGTIQNGEYKGKALPGEGYIVAVDDEAMPSQTSDKPDDNSNRDYVWIKTKDTRGIARGGYWDNRSDAGQYAAYMVSDPSFAGIGVGFRCVK